MNWTFLKLNEASNSNVSFSSFSFANWEKDLWPDSCPSMWEISPRNSGRAANAIPKVSTMRGNFRGSFYCRRGKNTAMLPQASCKECWARFFVYFPLSGAAGRRAEIATNAFYRILLRSLSVFRSNFMGHPNRIERHNDPFELNYEQVEKKTCRNSQQKKCILYLKLLKVA